MKEFLISYNLVGDNRNYDKLQLDKLLFKIGAEPISKTVWHFKSEIYQHGDQCQYAEDIKNILLPLLQAEDTVVVAEATTLAWSKNETIDTYPVPVTTF
ncbi:hypothetical protein NIES4074_28990 [Cylindrospermum sp. NIES-4074]|nr:hypothetical protein NIES4074_28990 [Cylindrospermum sp. NIES-4074]